MDLDTMKEVDVKDMKEVEIKDKKRKRKWFYLNFNYMIICFFCKDISFYKLKISNINFKIKRLNYFHLLYNKQINAYNFINNISMLNWVISIQ